MNEDDRIRVVPTVCVPNVSILPLTLPGIYFIGVFVIQLQDLGNRLAG